MSLIRLIGPAIAAALANLPREMRDKVLVVDDYTSPRIDRTALTYAECDLADPVRQSTSTAPSRAKGKASHKQQARKQQLGKK